MGEGNRENSGQERMEGMEKLANEAEAEVRIKERELYSLFGPPEEGVKVEVFDATSENPSFALHKTMRPDETEKELLPTGSEFAMAIQGRREKNEQGEVYWRVTGAKIKMDDKSLKLNEILPKGYVCSLESGRDDGHDADNDRIVLGKLSTVSDIVTLLHEVGHTRDNRKHPQESKEERVQKAKQMSGEEAMKKEQQDIKEKMNRERNAWAQAHQIAKEAKWPMEKLLQYRSAVALATYDVGSAEADLRGDTYKSFASKEQRKAMRSAEKQDESRKLRSLGELGSGISDAVELVLGKSVKELSRDQHDEIVRGFQFRYALPDTNKQYKIFLAEEEVVITESNVDGDLVETTSVALKGARNAYVTRLRVNMETGECEPIFTGTLNVLKEDGESSKPGESYGIAKPVLDNICADDNLEKMITAAFRKEYPDAIEPLDHNPKTGEKLTFDEKIKILQETSDKFNREGRKG